MLSVARSVFFLTSSLQIPFISQGFRARFARRSSVRPGAWPLFVCDARLTSAASALLGHEPLTVLPRRCLHSRDFDHKPCDLFSKASTHAAAVH